MPGAATHRCRSPATQIATAGGEALARLCTPRLIALYREGSKLPAAPGSIVLEATRRGVVSILAESAEISFQAAGASTRVKLVHSGWERLGESAAEARESYANGWPTVLGQLYKGHCERAGPHPNQVPDSEAR